MLIEFPHSNAQSIWKLYWNRVSQRPAFKFFVLGALFLAILFSFFLFSREKDPFPAYAYFEKVTRPENLTHSLSLAPQAMKDRAAFRSFEGMIAQRLLLEKADFKTMDSLYSGFAKIEEMKGPYSAFYTHLGQVSLLIAKGAYHEALLQIENPPTIPVEGQLYNALLAHKLAQMEHNEGLATEKAEQIRFFLFDKDSPLSASQKNFWLGVLGKDPKVIKDFYSQRA